MLSLDTEECIAHLKIDPRTWYSNLRWHPDGRQLAMTCADKTIKLSNVDDPEQTKLVTLERTVDPGSKMAFSHRGDLLATVAWDGILRLWDLRTGRQLKSLDSRSHEVPRFSPDDAVIAAGIRENSLQLWEVTAGGEYRALVGEWVGGPDLQPGAVATEGRLLAVGSEDSVELWDLKTGSYLSRLPIGATHAVAFDHSLSQALLTNGPGGVYRWPVEVEHQSGLVRIGPPHMVPLPGTTYPIVISRDGQFVAQAAGRSGARLLWPKTGKVIPLGPHPDTRTVVISADGRWVATGTHSGAGARIWEASSGKFVRELMPGGPCGVVGFSADGRWLATQCPFPQLWAVGTWQKAPAIQGASICFRARWKNVCR